ncbi:hypothetical protein FJZ36_07945 [Candidatus Poribacteria bacterium]|nr:hypothetical protein [Candidatus Poribacteria bacterium]
MAPFRAIHTIVLKPEVDSLEFERFMCDEFIPATLELDGCLDVQLLRGYRGSLPGVAKARVDYAWISLWRDIDSNNEAWSRHGEHATPDGLRGPQAKLLTYGATVTLIGGFTVAANSE